MFPADERPPEYNLRQHMAWEKRMREWSTERKRISAKRRLEHSSAAWIGDNEEEGQGDKK